MLTTRTGRIGDHHAAGRAARCRRTRRRRRLPRTQRRRPRSSITRCCATVEPAAGTGRMPSRRPQPRRAAAAPRDAWPRSRPHRRRSPPQLSRRACARSSPTSTRRGRRSSFRTRRAASTCTCAPATPGPRTVRSGALIEIEGVQRTGPVRADRRRPRVRALGHGPLPSAAARPDRSPALGPLRQSMDRSRRHRAIGDARGRRHHLLLRFLSGTHLLKVIVPDATRQPPPQTLSTAALTHSRRVRSDLQRPPPAGWRADARPRARRMLWSRARPRAIRLRCPPRTRLGPDAVRARRRRPSTASACAASSTLHEPGRHAVHAGRNRRPRGRDDDPARRSAPAIASTSVGFPAPGDYAPVLQGAAVRRIGAGPAPPPSHASRSPTSSSGNYHAAAGAARGPAARSSDSQHRRGGAHARSRRPRLHGVRRRRARPALDRHPPRQHRRADRHCLLQRGRQRADASAASRWCAASSLLAALAARRRGDRGRTLVDARQRARRCSRS